MYNEYDLKGSSPSTGDQKSTYTTELQPFSEYQHISEVSLSYFLKQTVW